VSLRQLLASLSAAWIKHSQDVLNSINQHQHQLFPRSQVTDVRDKQVLNLDFCTLSALPPVLGQLTALTTLDVEGNLYLGDSFRGATSAMGTHVTPFPAPFPLDLEGLQGLRYLNLNSCGLTAIPAVLPSSTHSHSMDIMSHASLEYQGESLPEDCRLAVALSFTVHVHDLQLCRQCKMETRRWGWGTHRVVHMLSM